jgi:thioredoxin 1
VLNFIEYNNLQIRLGGLLMTNKNIVTVTEENFEQEVLKSDIPVLVDFWAQWCGPCRAIAPIIEQLADDFEGRAKICKINVDEQGKLALKYKIMSIPTIMLFKDGQVVKTVIGGKPKVEFEALIESVI